MAASRPRGWLEPQGAAGAVLVGTQRSGAPDTLAGESRHTAAVENGLPFRESRPPLHSTAQRPPWCAPADTEGGAPCKWRRPRACHLPAGHALARPALRVSKGGRQQSVPWRPALRSPPVLRLPSGLWATRGDGQAEKGVSCLLTRGWRAERTYGATRKLEGADVCCILTV